VANNVSHAHNKTKTTQELNLRSKRLWLDSQKRYVRVRLAAGTLRTVTRKGGLDAYLRDTGLTLADIL
jgi:large subunit ribosomal protein L28